MESFCPYSYEALLHAAASIGSGSSAYSATNDTHGDLVCRAPDNTATCAGTPTGAQLGYDIEGRLATWQNAPSSPTKQTWFMYHREGHRVGQQSSGGSCAHT